MGIRLEILDGNILNRRSGRKLKFWCRNKATIAEIAGNVNSIEDALKNADAVFVATPHKEFDQALKPQNLSKRNIKLLTDGKNKYRHDKSSYEANNIIYRGIGI